MSWGLRFESVEDDGFPAVTNYDYEDNILIRGTDNRSFRWEETYLEANYIFQEATKNGGFEVAVGGTWNYSGLDRITSGAVIEANAISGWTLVGDSTYHVDTDAEEYLDYGLAISIATEHSVLLHGTGSTATIVNTNGYGSSDMPIGATYQLYILAHALSGTGEIQVALEGHVSSTFETSYDITGNEWVSSEVSNPIDVVPSGYTEYITNFAYTGFSGSNPDEFFIEISNTGGNPVILDEVHIDRYLAANAFIDHVIPTGYYLQITPDLGWHNIKEQFDNTSDEQNNPYLRTFGPFTIDRGNLVDNLDKTVTATIDEEAFTTALASNYTRYLWRAIAISPNSTLGKAGFPQRFEYIGRILDEDFSVTNVFNDPLSVTKIITGTKPSSSIVLVDGEEHPNMKYPTDTTWRLVIHLESSERTIRVRAKHTGGALSSPQDIELSAEVFTQTEQGLWNVFDEFGLLLDTPRIHGESNKDYKDRLKRAASRLATPKYGGIINGALNELGFRQIDDAIEIKLIDHGLYAPTDEGDMEITASSVKLRTEIYIREEEKIIDPVYGTIVLDKTPVGTPTNIQTDDEVNIPDYNIEVYHTNEEKPSNNTIVILDRSLHGKRVTIRYDYYEELFFSDYPGVGDLVTAINSLTSPKGNLSFTAKYSPKLSGSEESKYLRRNSAVLNNFRYIAFPWSPIQLNNISDKKFRERFLTDNNQYINTEYYSYVKELKSKLRVLWGYVEADRDFWDSVNRGDESLDHIPTLFDPNISQYYTDISGNISTVDSFKAWSKSYLGIDSETMENLGIDYSLYKPGVAHTNDLMPDLFTNFRLLPRNDNEQRSIVSNTKNDNNNQQFSGQK